MKSRSSTFAGARRHRSSPSEKKEAESGGAEQRGNLRRSTREHVTAGAPKSRARRRSRGLPLTRTRKDDLSETEHDDHSKEMAEITVTSTPPRLQSEQKDKDTEEVVADPNLEEEEETSKAKNRKPHKISALSKEHILTAIGEDGKLILVQVVVGGQLVKSRRRFQKSDSESNGTFHAKDKSFLGNDGNLFYCYVCGGFGDVVCCDGCPHVYHQSCLKAGSASRRSLENDDDPWYCPDCVGATITKPATELESRPPEAGERRVIKHRCCECQQSRSDIPLEPCEGCGSYLHHPSCRPDSPTSATKSPVLCSSCRAEVALHQEEDELLRERKKRKLDLQGAANKHDEAEEGSEEDTEPLRRRTRSLDGDHSNKVVDVPVSMDAENLGDKEAAEPTTSKRKRRDRDRDRDRDRLSSSPVRGRSSETKKKKKKKKEKERDKEKEKDREKDKEREKEKDMDKEQKNSKELASKETSSTANDNSLLDDEPTSFQSRPRSIQGLVQATPAFYFYLAENRYKIERVLARKHRYFNRLPKGMERNELVAREAALWWVKLRPIDHRRYMNMSMRDYEQRIIEWKEEKNIRDMLMARESDDEEDLEENEATETTPDDDLLTYELHERLYLGTSVGSKPYKPEPDQSHNRVLLDLLRDMRFHPLPMFSVTRTDADMVQSDGSSKFTIPHFDVHGPFSTSVGDECLGCTRGWAHFCPVLKRRLPAVEHRAKLQPPLSSLLATRVSLGLRPQMERIQSDGDSSRGLKDSDLFLWMENEKSAELNKLPFVPCGTLADPCSRADDIVQFIEEAVAMKIPEPPRPSPPGKAQSTSKKSGLSRGVLPTRSRKRPFDSTLPESNEGIGQTHVNKCGRCRTIITSDTGCVQCRRAQLVINMSKRQPSPSPSGSEHKNHKSDSKGGPGFLKVQTAMLGRVMMKDSNGETQSEGDQAIASAILRDRWNPCVILPPQTVLAPSPSRRFSSVTTGDSWDSSDTDDDSQGESDVEEEPSNISGVSNDNGKSNETDAPIRETELRPRAAARAAAAAAVSGMYDSNDALDRQSIAEKYKEEASELHKKALSVACSGILLALRRRDPLLLFASPVTAEGYGAVVKNPIDFGKIRGNVLSGSYQTLGAFVSDARLLCDNALAFNPPGSIYWKTAKELYDVLTVMQKRASQWMSAIRDAHARAWRQAPRRKKHDLDDAMDDGDVATDLSPEDPFETLRKTWPEAVDMLENSDWLRNQLAADFMRTKENETAYYGSLAVRRVAAAAEVCLAPYTDTGGVNSIVVKRTHAEDVALRKMINDKASKIVDPVQLKDISSWREEAIVRLMRRVQSRRLERRIGSENGCARCDGIGLDQEMKVAMNADRYGRNKKKGETETIPRVAPSRLELTTGLASATTRARIEERSSKSKEESYDSIRDVCVSLRGSRIHGWGLFADQAFKKGDLVAEYVGEYVSPPVADSREKIYQESRIQDYQFRLDDSLVIDATMNGGHGRYINHNCNPNCMTKIIPGKPPNEHLKRVLVLALRDIEPREELTYDYQFPLELDLDARIPCNCESDMCRGFMNWDLPEKGSNSHALRTQKRGANMRDRIRRLGRPLKK